MPKVDLNDISGGFASVDALNANFQLIEEALDNTLSRDGSTPNQMEADLDMNGYKVLNMGVDFGEEGFIYKGNWAGSTAYDKNNLVYVTVAQSATYGGSTYIATADHTSSGSFDTDIANWSLLALRGATGASGAGSGDVVGPGISVDGNLVLFDNTTGDLLADSGIAPASLATVTALNLKANSTDVSAALALKAPLDSPAFTTSATLDGDALATEAYVDANLGEQAGTTLTMDPYTLVTSVTQAHGLADVTRFFAYFECKAADLGYSIGDKVSMADIVSDQGTAQNCGISWDGTYVYFSTGSTLPKLTPKAGGNASTITNLRWKVIVKPYG